MRVAFQTYMRDALRMANQRHRNRARNNLHRPEGRNRNERALWTRRDATRRKLGQLYETKYTFWAAFAT